MNGEVGAVQKEEIKVMTEGVTIKLEMELNFKNLSPGVMCTSVQHRKIRFLTAKATRALSRLKQKPQVEVGIPTKKIRLNRLLLK